MFEIEMRGDSVIEKVEDLEDFAAIVPEKYTALKNIKSVEDGQRICKCSFLNNNMLIMRFFD